MKSKINSFCLLAIARFNNRSNPGYVFSNPCKDSRVIDIGTTSSSANHTNNVGPLSIRGIKPLI